MLSSSPQSGPAAPGSPSGISLARLLHVRDGERGVAARLSLSAFAIIFSYLLLKSAYKSIFLAAHGPERLPYIWIVTALAGTVVGLVHARLSRHLPLVPMVSGVLAGLAVTVLGFRLALYLGEADGVLAFALAVFGQLFGVLAMALLWLTANHLLEARQARRILPVIATGAILGGIAGGETVGLVVRRVGTHDLLWGTVLILGVAGGAMLSALRHRPEATRPCRQERPKTDGAFQLIASQPYLRLLVGIITVTMLCSSLVEYQFQWAVKHFIEEGDAATAYFGRWLGRISLLSLVFQLGLTTPLLRRFGVGLGLLLLPLGVLLLSGGMAFAPGLLLATALRVGDSSLRYSVNKSSVELLYLPLPLWLKDRTKLLIDTVLDRSAKGLAGLLLLGLFGLGLEVQGIAWVSGGLAVSWVLMALLLRTHYVDAFRQALSSERQTPGPVERLGDSELVASVLEGLKDENPRIVRQSLELLHATTAPAALRASEPSLLQLAAEADPELAWRALRLLSLNPSAPALDRARSHQCAADPRLAGAAAELLWSGWRGDSSSFVAEQEDFGPAATVLACGAVLAAGVDLPAHRIEALLWDRTPQGLVARKQLAVALTRGQLVVHRPLLRRLMADSSSEVAAAAILGAGQLADPSLVPFLVSALRRPQTRRPARKALAEMAPLVLPALAAHFTDSRLEHAVRKELPRAIADCGTEASRAWLVAALATPEPALRGAVLAASKRVLDLGESLPLEEAALELHLVRECQELAELLSLQENEEARGPAGRLFDKARGEAQVGRRERVFGLLALGGQARDWENVAAALAGEDPRLRASAVEFADVQLPQRLRRLLIPLIDELPPAEALRMVSRHVDIAPSVGGGPWARAARSLDRWLSACALAAGAEKGCEETLVIAQERLEDEDLVVRQAARAAADGMALGLGLKSC